MSFDWKQLKFGRVNKHKGSYVPQLSRHVLLLLIHITVSYLTGLEGFNYLSYDWELGGG